MSTSENKAVFLSYASQDAEAARRLCEALRAAGIEVWFDQNELVSGDAWDAKIRKQIIGVPQDKNDEQKCLVMRRSTCSRAT